MDYNQTPSTEKSNSTELGDHISYRKGQNERLVSLNARFDNFLNQLHFVLENLNNESARSFFEPQKDNQTANLGSVVQEEPRSVTAKLRNSTVDLDKEISRFEYLLDGEYGLGRIINFLNTQI